jgi:hypothetical protein
VRLSAELAVYALSKPVISVDAIQQILDFVTSLRWQEWLTIFGFLFGLVTLVAYIDQRRSNRQGSKLAEWAERNLDKSISEEQIRDLVGQKRSMEAEIRSSIPALARAAVIKAQVQLRRDAIAEHYIAWEALNHELATEEAVARLSPEIRDAIVNQVMPDYLKEQEQNRLRTRISVLSVGSAIVSSIIPFGLGALIALFLVPALGSAAARLYLLSEQRESAVRTLQGWLRGGYVAFGVGAVGAGLASVFTGDYVDRNFGIAFLVAGVVVLILYPFASYLIRKWLTSIVRPTFSMDK